MGVLICVLNDFFETDEKACSPIVDFPILDPDCKLRQRKEFVVAVGVPCTVTPAHFDYFLKESINHSQSHSIAGVLPPRSLQGKYVCRFVRQLNVLLILISFIFFSTIR
jgi:hypothetical protein